MKNQYSFKKQLNTTLFKKKLESNIFSLAIENTVESGLQIKKIRFTKALLQNNALKNIWKTNNLNFPLTFFFFDTFENYKTFLKKKFHLVNILKIKHKVLKTYYLDPKFFFKNQIKNFFFN